MVQSCDAIDACMHVMRSMHMTRSCDACDVYHPIAICVNSSCLLCINAIVGSASFGVNLRVQGLLSVYVFVSFRAKCTLITSLSEFISVFKQPTSSVVFRHTIHPCHLRTIQSQLWGLRYCDTYQLCLCVRSVVAITLSCNCRTES